MAQGRTGVGSIGSYCTAIYIYILYIFLLQHTATVYIYTLEWHNHIFTPLQTEARCQISGECRAFPPPASVSGTERPFAEEREGTTRNMGLQ